MINSTNFNKENNQMLNKMIIATCLTALSMGVFAANTYVVMDTNMGEIEIELYQDKAPITVNNFQQYIKSQFYQGTIFHRVIPGFMIQGGGMDKDMVEKNHRPTIVNESDNGLSNRRGSLAMARTQDPNSAASQFFINLVDNTYLDRSPANAGYAVFGQVIKGMDVVDRIAQVPTMNYQMQQNVPIKTVEILDVQIKRTK